jgi:hypothetical protein
MADILTIRNGEREPEEMDSEKHREILKEKIHDRIQQNGY